MLKIPTSELNAALATLLKINSAKMSLPILSCVKLEQKGTTLELSASNLDEYSVEIVGCSGKMKPVCVSLKFLAYAIGDGEETTLDLDGEILNVSPSGANLNTLDASEFPEWPSLKKSEGLAVNCEDLAFALEVIAPFRALDDVKFSLQPIHVTGSAKNLYAEASDGRRLAWLDKALICGDFDILVMGIFVGNFCAAARRTGAALLRNENHLTIKHDSGSYVCKIPEVNYPNTKSAMVGFTPNVVGELDIQSAIHVISLGIQLSSGRQNGSARFDFDGTGLRIWFKDTKHSASMDKKIVGEFKENKCTLNLSYVMDALKALQSIGQTKATIKMVDEFSPVALEGGDLKVLVMPLRLN